MLSCLRVATQSSEFAGRYQFEAAAPNTGPLADRLRDLKISVTDFRTHRNGNKQSPEALQHDMELVLTQAQPHIVHSNSLSMSRNVGRMPDQVFSGMLRSGHLRDIIKLNKAAVRDLNRNDGLVAVSEATRQFHVVQGVRSTLCRTIPNGVDVRQFCGLDRSEMRKKLFPNLPADATLLLNVGQICLRKGQDLLVKAVLQLLDHSSNLHLVLAGERHSTKPESVRYEQRLSTEFEAANRRGQLHLLGSRKDIPELMNACDVLVHSAKQEPLGRVLLEAAACGLPVVATKVGGTPEIFPDDSLAILTDPTAEAMESALRRHLESPEKSAQRARRSQRRVQEQFCVDRAARALLRYWDSLSAAPLSRRR